MLNLTTGQIKIIDFGISVIHDSDDSLVHDKSWTQEYKAWELYVEGSIKYNPFKTDIFAAGITLLQSAVGCYPFAS